MKLVGVCLSRRHNKLSMGPLQLSGHVVLNRQTGKQMMHGDMLNKENSNLVALFNMSQCVICKGLISSHLLRQSVTSRQNKST